MECRNCEEEFEVNVEYTPNYSSSKIEYKNCADCGREYRFESRSYPKPSKYDHLNGDDYTVCENCYARAIFEDL